MILIGGGQEYYGPTSARDKCVVQETAKALFNLVGNSVTIVTGGMPGIPMDFVKTWLEVGGTKVYFIVSEEFKSTLTDVVPSVVYQCMGVTQAERRKALTQIKDIKAAFFVQGGQYTTDEIMKCYAREEKIKVVCFVGSGGASGGKIPYKEQNFIPLDDTPDWMYDSDPDSDPKVLGEKFAQELKI